MSPKEPLKIISAAFSPGALVMYENDGAPLLAVVLNWKKNRYQVLNERNREMELDAVRLYGLPGRIPSALTTHAEQVAFLTSVRQRAETLAAGNSLTEAWELLKDDSREIETSEIAGLIFSNETLEHHLATRFLLLDDKLFFKRHKDLFSPRPEEVVEELRKAEAARVERALAAERTVEFLRARAHDFSIPIPPELAAGFYLLEEVAISSPALDSGQLKEAKELIDRAAGALAISSNTRLEQRAYEILVAIGHFTPTTNLALIRARPPLTFSSAAQSQAEAIETPQSWSALPAEEQALRLDLTHLTTFTIDDVTTNDSDDAASLEVCEGGYRIGVHISDVASAIAPGTALDFEAQKRATSIYLPEGALHMLPKILAEDRLSLSQGSVRRCLSCIFQVRRDFSIVETKVVPTLVHITHRFNYNQVDEILQRGFGAEHDPALELLYNFALERETQRHQQGGMRIHKQEVQVQLEPDGGFRLVEVDEQSPARSLIAELAVLANNAFAEFGVKNGFPLVFRGQPPPDEDDRSLDSIPEGPARDYALRARLKRSNTDTVAQYHATLGLRAYAQLTSPIRRYLDLVNQRQILSFIRSGSPLYREAELRALIDAVELPLGAAAGVSKETKRFWMLKFLERRYREGGVITGTVTRNDLKTPMVELDEIYTAFPVRTRKHPALGTQVRARIAVVDPVWDYVKLEEC